jgi:hypothetical protein
VIFVHFVAIILARRETVGAQEERMYWPQKSQMTQNGI